MDDISQSASILRSTVTGHCVLLLANGTAAAGQYAGDAGRVTRRPGGGAGAGQEVSRLYGTGVCYW